MAHFVNCSAILLATGALLACTESPTSTAATACRKPSIGALVDYWRQEATAGLGDQIVRHSRGTSNALARVTSTSTSTATDTHTTIVKGPPCGEGATMLATEPCVYAERMRKDMALAEVRLAEVQAAAEERRFACAEKRVQRGAPQDEADRACLVGRP